MNPSIAIIGASARAAAQSARRAGLSPWAADLFADVDLRACCPATRIDRYPHQFVSALAAAPPGPWMYVGGLENHPELVDQMARQRPLLGVAGQSLRRVRDPFELAAVVRQTGCRYPESRLAPNDVPTDGTWLVKPRHGSGGIGVLPWHGSRQTLPDKPSYWQARIDGLPAAAVYVAAGGRARLLGVTQQLIGPAWCGTGGFRYAGSLGPLTLENQVRQRLDGLGDCLSEAFELVGLVGVDLVLTPSDVWVVEVNPRYTASVEVLERATAVSAIAHHLAACCQGILPTPASMPGSTPESRKWGKAIVFASHSATVPEWLVRYAMANPPRRSWPPAADVPHAGTQIAKYHPIMTVFAAGTTLAAVEDRLRRRVAHTQAVLNNAP
ncbi:MAG: ATP-grasp domain-containing protein [Pirellulales bacterium]